MKESYYTRVLLFNLIAPFIWSIALIIEFMQLEGFTFSIIDVIPLYAITMALTFVFYTPLWLLPMFQGFEFVKWANLTGLKVFFILLVISGILNGYLTRELFDSVTYMLIYGLVGFLLLPKTIEPI